MNTNKILIVGLTALSTISICSCAGQGGSPFSSFGNMNGMIPGSDEYCKLVNMDLVQDFGGVCEKLVTLTTTLNPNIQALLTANKNKPQDELWATLTGGAGGAAIGCSIDAKTGCIIGTGVGLVLGNLVGKTAAEKRATYDEANKELDMKIQTTKKIIEDINRKIATLKTTSDDKKLEIESVIKSTQDRKLQVSKAKIALTSINNQLSENKLLMDQVASGVTLLDREIADVTKHRDEAEASYKNDLDKRIVALNGEKSDYERNLNALNGIDHTLVAGRDMIAPVAGG